MMKCPSCGYPLEGNERYCGMCGTPVDHITRSMDTTGVASYGASSKTESVTPLSPATSSSSRTTPLSPLHPSQMARIQQAPLDSSQPGITSDVKRKRKLQRTRDRWLAGVIGGVANYLGVNANVLRVVYVVICYFLLVSGSGGSLLLLLVALYIVGVVLMPEEPPEWPNL